MVCFGVGLDGMVPEKRGGEIGAAGEGRGGEFDRSCLGRQRGGGLVAGGDGVGGSRRGHWYAA